MKGELGAMEALKAAGGVILGLIGVVALIFVSALFFLGAEKVSEAALPALDDATVIALIICIIILLPLSVFKTTRFISTWGFLIASFVFGIDVWMYGFLVTLHFWGVGGVFVGLCLVGIGVVPFGMIAAALHSSWDVLAELAFGIAMTYATRTFGFYLEHTLASVVQSKGEGVLEAQIAVNTTGQQILKSVGSPKRREGLLTIRGYVTIAHIIVLGGCWYLLSFLANGGDEAGIFGTKWLIGYFLLAEFVFTNNWFVARVEHGMEHSDESISSVRNGTPLSNVMVHPAAMAVETSRPKWDGLSPEQEAKVTRAMKEALGVHKLNVVERYVSRPSALSRKTRSISIILTLSALLLSGWIARYEWFSQTACTERALTAKELILIEGSQNFLTFLTVIYL